MPERILVTGGAGFIGSHLARAYIAEGHTVAVLDDLSTGHSRNVPGHAEFYRADVADYEAVLRACQDFRPTVINHHAAQSMVKVSARDPLLTHCNNVMGTWNVAEAACAVEARRVVFASSGAVYGEYHERDGHNGAGPGLQEHDLLRPPSAYGFSKLAGESYLRFYGETRGLQPVIFRYGNVYGPGQNPQGEAGVVAVFAGKLLAGEPVTVFGDGEQTRDYIHVSDVCRANLLALDGEPGTYNIATGTSTSVLGILAALERITGTALPHGSAPVTPGDARYVRLDVSRAKGRLRFAAIVGLEAGLHSVVDHLRNNGD